MGGNQRPHTPIASVLWETGSHGVLPALRSVAAFGMVKIVNSNVLNSKIGAPAHRIAVGTEIFLNLPAIRTVVSGSVMCF